MLIKNTSDRFKNIVELLAIISLKD